MLLRHFSRMNKFLVLLTLVVMQSEFVASDASSVCWDRVTKTTSTLVSYREWYTKRSWGLFKKKKSRINYQWQTRLEVQYVTKCCEGYHNLHGHVCDPLCKSGCEHGSCQAPNNCYCDVKYRAVFIDGLSRCVPTCWAYGRKGCGEHGTCTAPDSCSCDKGYGLSKYSDRSAPDFPCNPVCDPPCVNGACTKPGYCECHVGHKKDPKSSSQTCSPVCDPPCINGACTKPGYCECHVGHKKDPKSSSQTCWPVCDPPCVNGACTKPGYCECYVSHKKDPKSSSQMCWPLCDPPCVNGACTKPGYCECHVGHKKDPSGSTQSCWPVCEPPCVNGTCTKPGYCECHVGHKKDPNSSSQTCSPVCDPPCVNGACTKPGYCECHVGHKKDPSGSTQTCWPVCEPPCVNGTCTKPGYCECHVDHKKDPNSSSQTCSPVCDPPCVNGTCTKPGYCECHVGHKKDPKSSSQTCWPVCDPPCINGACTKPDYCECHSGYEKKQANSPQHCSPVCSPECNENAHCDAPDTCLCDEGYTVASSTLLPSVTTSDPLQTTHAASTTSSDISEVICRPVCEPDCKENESCVGPNVCQCDPGYQPNVDGSGLLNCLPICDPPCRNARCENPNQCVCHSGYSKHPIEDFGCDPICQEGCYNATCTRPNHCECLEGYEKPSMTTEPPDAVDQASYENSCSPSCPRQCVNGTCVAPGQCLCDPGYVLMTSLVLMEDGTTIDYLEDNGNTVASFSVTTHETTINDADHSDYTSTTLPSMTTEGLEGNSTVINGRFMQFCQPVCQPPCPNGAECIAPDQCSPQPDGNEASINSTHRVDSIEDCGENVDFLNENGICFCKYGWTGWRCEKPSLCGLVIEFRLDDENSTTLRSLDSSNETTEAMVDDSSDMRMIASDDDTGTTIDWRGPMCADDCRIFVTSSEISGSRSDRVANCYLLESESAGVFSLNDFPRHPGSRDGTFVCFIGIESECNVRKFKNDGEESGSSVGIIIGVTVLVAIVTMIGTAVYFRRKRGIRRSPIVSMNNSTALIHQELISLDTTEESSTL